jgi:tripartite-type tricarboxylate transporter receptor subunit TctC
MRIGKARLFFALIWVCCIGSGAFAQTISNPIHLIVPYAAGGPIDVTARVLAERVKDTLGKRHTMFLLYRSIVFNALGKLEK